MKKVFSSIQFNEVGMLKSFFEEEGIDCTIVNEGSSMTSSLWQKSNHKQILVSEFPPQDGEGKGGVDFIDLTTTPSS